MQRICFNVVSFLLLALGDHIFLPGEEAKGAYFVVKGQITYSQDPRSSSVPAKRTVEVQKRHWCCEAALWCHWIHVGMAEAVNVSELNMMHAGKLSAELQQHDVIRYIVNDYVRSFHKHLTVATLEIEDEVQRDDLSSPGTDFDIVLISMSRKSKVVLGLAVIESIQSRRLAPPLPWWGQGHGSTVRRYHEPRRGHGAGHP